MLKCPHCNKKGIFIIKKLFAFGRIKYVTCKYCKGHITSPLLETVFIYLGWICVMSIVQLWDNVFILISSFVTIQLIFIFFVPLRKSLE